MSFFQTFLGGSSVLNHGSSGQQNISVRNGVINIDGRTFHGQNVVCNNEGIWIDGKLITPEGDGAPPKYRVTSIIVDGDAGPIEAGNADVTVKGSVAGKIRSTNGNITVEGDIDGDVDTTNGNVFAGGISGRVSSINGNISERFKGRRK
jgi:hypothetical protein